MSNKSFWTFVGSMIMFWSLICPNFVRALIGITIFLVGVLIQEKENDNNE